MAEVPLSTEDLRVVEDLLRAAARTLDEERLEEWLDLFAEQSSYVVTTRENVVQNLPAGVLSCETKDMIRDRVFYLQRGSAYTYTYARHLITLLTAERTGDGRVHARTNFAVFQTTVEGETRLFVTGQYEDHIQIEASRARFAARRVVLDTAAIPTLLAMPV